MSAARAGMAQRYDEFVHHLQEARDAMDKIATYTAVGKERFLSESHWHDAAVRQLKSSERRRSAFPTM